MCDDHTNRLNGKVTQGVITEKSSNSFIFPQHTTISRSLRMRAFTNWIKDARKACRWERFFNEFILVCGFLFRQLTLQQSSYLSKIITEIGNFMNSSIYGFVSKHFITNWFSTKFQQFGNIFHAPVGWDTCAGKNGKFDLVKKTWLESELNCQHPIQFLLITHRRVRCLKTRTVSRTEGSDSKIISCSG